MTTSPTTRVRKAQPRRSIRRPAPWSLRRLPRISWGWAAGIAFGGYIVAKTYPVQSAAAVAVVAAAVILHVVRPARMAGLFARIDRLYASRRAMPQQASLGRLQTMHWAKFEQAVIVRAEQSDYVTHAVLTGKTGDRGCDGIVHLTNGIRVLIQCKRYKNTKKINGDTVRATDGAKRQAGCDLAVIVTSSDFTAEGQIAAASLGVIPFNGAATSNWLNGGRAPWEPVHR